MPPVVSHWPPLMRQLAAGFQTPASIGDVSATMTPTSTRFSLQDPNRWPLQSHSTSQQQQQQPPQQQQQRQQTMTLSSTPCSSTSASARTQRFEPVCILGQGAEGFVQLAFDNELKQPCAIKYIDRGWSRRYYKYVLREILNHQQLSLCKHPHIVEFYEVFLTPSYLGVVMEYIDGTNLQQHLEKAGGSLPEDDARFIFQQLVIAVDFCHQKGKVNRDIKLANILVAANGLPVVKLCDFGFSKDKFADSLPQTQLGTALFSAPEIFTTQKGQTYDAEAADIWSCGVVLFMLLFGGHPFVSPQDLQEQRAVQMMKLIENAQAGFLQLTPRATFMPSAMDLIQHILCPAPKQRYTMKDVMLHPWFQSKLPVGALVLNDLYLAIPNGPEPRQSPADVKQLVRAAVNGHGMASSGYASSGAGTSAAATAAASRTSSSALSISDPAAWNKAQDQGQVPRTPLPALHAQPLHQQQQHQQQQHQHQQYHHYQQQQQQPVAATASGSQYLPAVSFPSTSTSRSNDAPTAWDSDILNAEFPDPCIVDLGLLDSQLGQQGLTGQAMDVSQLPGTSLSTEASHRSSDKQNVLFNSSVLYELDLSK